MGLFEQSRYSHLAWTDPSCSTRKKDFFFYTEIHYECHCLFLVHHNLGSFLPQKTYSDLDLRAIMTYNLLVQSSGIPLYVFLLLKLLLQ